MATLQVRVPDELAERVKAQARELDRSVSWVVRDALERGLLSAEARAAVARHARHVEVQRDALEAPAVPKVRKAARVEGPCAHKHTLTGRGGSGITVKTCRDCGEVVA